MTMKELDTCSHVETDVVMMRFSTINLKKVYVMMGSGGRCHVNRSQVM